MDGGPQRRASGPALFQREVDDILQTRATPTPPPTNENGFRKGSKVQHASFGFGVILNIEGDHIQVAFKHAGIKKLLADYLELS